jgi:hypothetical protein
VERSVASQLHALAAWNLWVKSLLLMKLPCAAEAGIWDDADCFVEGEP